VTSATRLLLVIAATVVLAVLVPLAVVLVATL